MKIKNISYIFISIILFQLLLLAGENYLGLNKIFAGQTPQETALKNNMERWNMPVFNMGAGLAYAADARGLQGGLTNPASLSRIQSNQFSIEYQTWNENWDLISAGIARPISGREVFAAQVSWLDYGELTPDYDTQLYRPQGNEFKGGLTYSRLFYDRFSIGASVNVMTSKIGFRERETDFAGDLGLLIRLTPDFWIGAVGKNLNGSLIIDDTENKLPTEYRAGMAWYLFQERLGLTADLSFREAEEDAGDDTIGMAGGIRFMVSSNLRVTTGYHTLDDDYDGFTGALELMFPLFQWNLAVINSGEENIVRSGGTMRF